MANNRLHGYTPKTVNEKDGNRLDKFNPYEFRRGMDYELVDMGCARLAESTVDEREKATETVLKNLEEHGGYYTSLTTYEVTYRNTDKKPAFKKWLSEQENFKMQEVKPGDKDSKHKEDKMVELKEAITKEIKNILGEAKDKEAEKINKADAEKEVTDEKSASKGAKGKEKAIAALEKEIEKLKAEKDKNKDKLSVPLKRYKDGKLTADEYRKLSDATVKRNKEIVKRLGEIEKEKEAISLNEKLGRREVAKTMMEKDTHMAILEIIKEYGISLREGSEGIKAYYEIAKTAYQEGYMEGLQKN
jgi:hypothetical protein|tara:strand:- start:57 stop:965 length:909 start_codon:yes stop_codon:yes gene_type:complete